MKTEISESKLKKYTEAINYTLKTIREHKGAVKYKTFLDISRQFGVDNGLYSHMKAAGVIENVRKGLYKANYVFVEPITTRKVIEAQRKYFSDLYHRNKGVPVKTAKIIPVVKDAPSKPKRSKVLPNKRPRTVSILWGLLKWSK